MSAFGRLFARAGRRAPLRVENGDAFSACCEKHGITAREAEIIRLLIEGKDNKGITSDLFISDHTVKNHIHHIYRKLGIRNRVQLIQCFRMALGEPGRQSAAQGTAPAAGDISAGLRKAALPAALLLVVFAAILVAWRPWGKRPRLAAFPPPPALALLDFENLSADSELEKWVTGLPLLLATDLVQSKYIRMLGDDAVFGALKKFNLTERRRYSREELRRLAKEMKADYLVSGSLMMAGGRIVVTAFLQDARTGAAIRTEKLDCLDEQDLMQKADGLARLIRSELNRGGAQAQGDIDLDIEVLTTSSALAYKYYSEGSYYHRTGEYDQSLLMLKKAVELDPEFAMAYRMMAVDARNLGYFQRESEYMRKAFDLTGRLPENCRERHLIRAGYYGGSEATFELAAAEFKLVLEDHPYDLVANNNLGILCYELEDFEAAAKYADVLVRQGTSNPFPHYTKAISLRALGRSDEALGVLVDYHENFPANRLIYQTLVDTLIEADDIAGASAALDKALSVFPDPSWANWKGVLLFLTQGADAARAEFRQLFLMEEAPWRLGAHMRLALLALTEGRFSQAEKECRYGAEFAETIGEPGWSSDFRCLLGQVLLEEGKLDGALVELRRAVERAEAAVSEPRIREGLRAQAQACVRAGDLATAEVLTRRFQALAGPGTSSRAARAFSLFLGMLELEKNQLLEAVNALERAIAQLPKGRAPESSKYLIYYSLGQAREKRSDFAGALSAYENITSSAGSRLGLGEIFPRAVLGRARAEDKLGRSAPAIEGYRSFLTMWKDADPGRPEVAEARLRLEVLSGGSGRGI